MTEFIVSCKIIVSKNIEELSGYFAQLLMEGVSLSNNYFTLAFSGGNTPKTIFNFLSENYKDKIDWSKIIFFWGDERCVPPTDNESNFKNAKENLFDRLKLDQKNIFRIRGEDDPEKEVIRYSKIISNNVVKENSFPQFDLIMLGLGEDGHTASIFPGRLDLFSSNKICDIAEHPVSKQKRITLTGSVINNAKKNVFIVSGESKSKIVDVILNKKEGFEKLPASFVNPPDGELIWLLDKSANAWRHG
jgi:6-phosphogluconolactonase